MGIDKMTIAIQIAIALFIGMCLMLAYNAIQNIKEMIDMTHNEWLIDRYKQNSRNFLLFPVVLTLGLLVLFILAYITDYR